MKFFETIKLLFPMARAFELFINNNKRKIVKAVSILPEAIRHEAELVYMDLFPDTTRFPEKWEETFAVYFTAKELPKRRNILDSLWKINNGGQSWEFLQEMLQGISDTIRVIENVPVTDPRTIRVVRIAVCGNRIMVCGNRQAVCDARLGGLEWLPIILRNDVSETYDIHDDRRYWEMCFFVCKGVKRDEYNNILYVERLRLNIVWKNYIEYLILKIKPVHSTAIIFVEWEED